MIDLFRPYVPEDAVQAVVDVLHSRFIGQGPKVDEFEKEFEKFFAVENVVAVNSGTSALETAYDLVGLGEGDEVIVPVLNCTAGGTALLRRKCKIIFADILEKTLCIDPEDVRKKITPFTRAIVQVHLGGVRADVPKFYNPIDGSYIPIISDACQALGIFTGDITCNSYQAIKSIGTPDLGSIVVRNAEEAHKAKLLRWFGIDRNKKILNSWQCFRERQMTFDIDLLGFKRQPNDVAAAMALVGLKHYNEILEHRRKIFNIYKTELANIDGIKLIDGEENVYWLATLLIEKKRDEFAKLLFENDVDSNLVQVRNDIYHVFGGQRLDLPIMNKIEEKYISIPVGMNISAENAEKIVDVIKNGW
jgi:dTDP-4-amino-4,6-dideoxygalactose transaminase